MQIKAIVIYGPVCYNTSLFGSAYFLMPICRPLTLKRSKKGRFIDENGGFRKFAPKWRLLKTEVYLSGMDGKNAELSGNTDVPAYYAVAERISGAVEAACSQGRKKFRKKPGNH